MDALLKAAALLRAPTSLRLSPASQRARALRQREAPIPKLEELPAKPAAAAVQSLPDVSGKATTVKYPEIVQRRSQPRLKPVAQAVRVAGARTWTDEDFRAPPGLGLGTTYNMGRSTIGKAADLAVANEPEAFASEIGDDLVWAWRALRKAGRGDRFIEGVNGEIVVKPRWDKKICAVIGLNDV